MYLKITIIVTCVLLATPSLAQQQTPSQMALQLNGVISNWALTLESQSKQIETLTKETADLKARLAEKEKPKDK